jgi:ATP-dependent Clp endopeptidase proteolytic subunit ClpP
MTGAMIALVPGIEDAARLAVEGGECPTHLHTTLVYLGEAADIPDDAREQIVAAVRAYVDALPPVEAEGFSVSAFNPGDSNDREPCIVLGLSGDELDPVHDDILDAIADVAGLDVPKQHSPWTPHITLVYTGDVGRVAILANRVGPVVFDRIRVAFAGEYTDVPLVETEPDAGMDGPAVDTSTTNTARLLPIRAFTMPSGADRTDMGRATRARDARMRARADQQTWYRIENKTSADTAEIYLYSEIGMWGVSADMFAREMSDVKAKTINLHINSPGGEVFDGVAIYNTLKNHPARIEVSIDGLAASAASFIACAGDRIVIMRHAQMMIHDAAGFCMGNGKDMSSMADLLESLSDTIADIYTQRAGGDIAMWRERMRAETWLNAQEALALNLVDEVAGNPLEPDAKPKSEWDLTVFAYAGREHAPAPVLVPVAMADGPTDSAPEATDTPAAEAVADEMPVDAQVEAVTGQADQPADGEATAEVEPDASTVEPLATAPTPEPVTAQASAWATPAWLNTPADPWLSLVAGLTNTEPSTADDQLASAQEATK